MGNIIRLNLKTDNIRIEFETFHLGAHVCTLYIYIYILQAWFVHC